MPSHIVLINIQWAGKKIAYRPCVGTYLRFRDTGGTNSVNAKDADEAASFLATARGASTTHQQSTLMHTDTSPQY